jgi:S-DNA-T family DNA segregation ATPase FtsK/SpoIIIE
VLRPEGRPPSLRFRAPSVRIPLRWLVAGWLVLVTWRLTRWLAMHPRTTLVLAVAVWLTVAGWWPVALWLLAGLAGALAMWWALNPDAVRVHVTERLQLRLRAQWTYRRMWQPAMVTAGLSFRDSWGGDLPTLRKVSDDGGRDLLRVAMLPGQTLEQWTGATAALAQTFGARSVRVRRIPDRPQELLLVVARRGGARMDHVTESAVDRTPQPAPAGRGAFPRAPRSGAA